MRVLYSAPLLVTALCFPGLSAEEEPQIEFRLRSRDAETGVVREALTVIASDKLGVVVVDIWNWHWCKTAAARIHSFVPRMNACLDALRDAGVQIYVCPTDVVDAYVGTPQREKALALEPLPLPEAIRYDCPPPPNGPGCACIVRCRVNYGWNALNPQFKLDKRDLMPNSRKTLFTLAKKRGITHLLYLGVHTQVCLLGKDIGLRNMKALGFQCILARDLTDSHPDYDPARGSDPDGLTGRTVDHFERYLCASVNLKEELDRLGLWKHRGPLDPVRAAPWGTRERAHLFEGETTVTLSTPLVPGARIHYTTDGTEPTPQSSSYTAPIAVRETTTLRAQGFRGDTPVCVESTFRYVKLAAMPPRPHVPLDTLEPASVLGPGHSPSDLDHRFSPVSQPPQKNRSNRGQPLLLGGKPYSRGLGVHAPNRVAYDVDPNWERFVALTGVDENILVVNNASDLGCVPSVIFRIFFDGQLAAESPVMRFLSPPWRFDVPVPKGAKRIALIAHPAGDGNREDLGNWVRAGFVLTAAAARALPAPTTYVPGRLEELEQVDGFAWYRCFVKVPIEWRDRDLTLHIPCVDDCDETYFNGHLVGRTGTIPPAAYRSGTDTPRRYPIPAKHVREGEWNTLTVRLYDGGGAAGIRRQAPQLSDGSEVISLEGDWQVRVGDETSWKEPPADRSNIEKSRATFEISDR